MCRLIGLSSKRTIVQCYKTSYVSYVTTVLNMSYCDSSVQKIYLMFCPFLGSSWLVELPVELDGFYSSYRSFGFSICLFCSFSRIPSHLFILTHTLYHTIPVLIPLFSIQICIFSICVMYVWIIALLAFCVATKNAMTLTKMVHYQVNYILLL